MGKQTDQGTRWESRIVERALKVGRFAMRLAKTGTKYEPDVKIAPLLGDPPVHQIYMLPAVAWERWVGSKGKGRRRAVRMITMTEDDFFTHVVDKTTVGWYIQCKSTQVGSLSTWLEGIAEAARKETR